MPAPAGEIHQVAVRTEFWTRRGSTIRWKGRSRASATAKAPLPAPPGSLWPDLCPHAWRRRRSASGCRSSWPAAGLPALGPSFRRLHLQAACRRLCRRPHEQAGLKGTQIGGAAVSRQARRICGESGGRNGVGRFGPHCPRSKAGFGNLRHLPGARGGPPLSPCPPERWVIEMACREQNMGQGRKTDGMHKPLGVAPEIEGDRIMSFSGQVKSELCRTVPAQRCCALAQCFGILLYCNTFTGDGVRIV